MKIGEIADLIGEGGDSRKNVDAKVVYALFIGLMNDEEAVIAHQHSEICRAAIEIGPAPDGVQDITCMVIQDLKAGLDALFVGAAVPRTTGGTDHS